jgi:hypothetical protein
MSVARSLRRLAEDLVDELDDGGLLVVFVEHVDLLLHVHERGVAFAAGEDLFEGVGADAVTRVREAMRHSMGRSMAWLAACLASRLNGS